MKKSRYTEEQIIAVLKEADAGTKVQDLRRKHNISDVTFCQWRSKYGGMEVPEVPLLKALVADLSCDNQALKLVVSKKVVTPVAKRETAGPIREELGLSERRSCRGLGVGRSSLQYVPRLDCNATLRVRLKELAGAHRRFGSPRLHVLLKREGWVVNHDVYRAFLPAGRPVLAGGASAAGSDASELAHGLRHRQPGQWPSVQKPSPSSMITAASASQSRPTSRSTASMSRGRSSDSRKPPGCAGLITSTMRPWKSSSPP